MQLNRRPKISLTISNILRIAQGHSSQGNYSRVEVAIRPTFAVYEKTDVTAVVTSLHLSMTPLSPLNSSPAYFVWTDVVDYDYDIATGASNGRILSDPGPIIVTQDKPQSPMVRFIALQTWLQPGRWKATLTGERTDQPPLVSEFCVDISQNIISAVAPHGAPGTLGTFVLRNDLSPPSAQAPNCYHG